MEDVHTVDAALAVAVVVMVLVRERPLVEDARVIARVSTRLAVRLVAGLVELTRSLVAGSKGKR